MPRLRPARHKGLWFACSLMVLGGLVAVVVPQVSAEPAQSQPSSEQQAASAPRGNRPLSPEESLAQIKLAPGLKIELVAAEPMVVDPVAIRFDARGRMWVVEMRDYPHGPAEGEKPQSRIRILTDTDGDGRYDEAVTFADNLMFATGVQPWGSGAFVTLGGQLAYFPDEDGDGRAEQPTLWFTGFAEENSQLRANHPRYALDNQIYVANGLRGGKIRDARRDDSAVVSISGMDFRFDPHTGKYAAATGVGQFGLAFDDYGNRFVCSNRNPLKHIVLPDEVLRRNPQLAAPSGSNDVAAAGEDSRVFPISSAWTTSNLHAGQFTAACGVIIYRGDALPAEFAGSAFTCEPTGNLVHREIMKPAGGSFISKPDREGVEFLASADNWFRAVNMENGPDGALYVVDMYRAVIEHPQFMPAELKNRPDLLWGNDCGRIYRIVAEDAPPKLENYPRDLQSLNNEQLVALLDHPNAWQRETAARLIYERQAKEVVPQLKKLAANAKRDTGRIHALWALQGLGALDEAQIVAACGDASPRVREQGAILAGGRLNDSQALRQAVLKLAGDDDVRVRFQTAVALGTVEGKEVTAALARIALAEPADVWTRTAVASAVPNRAHLLLDAVVTELQSEQGRKINAGEQGLLEQLASLAGAGPQEHRLPALERLLSLKQQGTNQMAMFALTRRWTEAARRQDRSLKLSADLNPAVGKLLAQATELANDRSAEPELRREAISLLTYAADGASLDALARREPNQSVRLAALNAIAQNGTVEQWSPIFKNFAGESPGVRRGILDAALTRAPLTAALLDAIEAGQVRPTELDQVRSGRLLRHGDPKIRQRAAKLLAAAVPQDRQKVLEDYQKALELAADPVRGQQVFRQRCATCHRIGDIGVNVAPDISDSRTKTPIQILTDILQPNRAIDSNYISYTIVTTDGRALTGIIASETGGSVTIRQPENKSITLSREEIDEMQSSGVSLMPEGLEKDITHQQMADLIAFIKNWRYLDGQVPLGKNAGN